MVIFQILTEKIKENIEMYFKTPSDCRRFDKLLNAYIEGALDIEPKDFVIAHKRKCKRCREEFSTQKKLLNLLSSAQITETLPQDFAVELHSKLLAAKAAKYTQTAQTADFYGKMREFFAEAYVKTREAVIDVYTKMKAAAPVVYAKAKAAVSVGYGKAKVFLVDAYGKAKKALVDFCGKVREVLSDGEFYNKLRTGAAGLGRPRVYAPVLAAVLLVSVYAVGLRRATFDDVIPELYYTTAPDSTGGTDEAEFGAEGGAQEAAESETLKTDISAQDDGVMAKESAPPQSTDTPADEAEGRNMRLFDAAIADANAPNNAPSSAPQPQAADTALAAIAPKSAGISVNGGGGGGSTAEAERVKEYTDLWTIKANDVDEFLTKSGFAGRAKTEGSKKVLILSKSEFDGLLDRFAGAYEFKRQISGTESYSLFRVEIIQK